MKTTVKAPKWLKQVGMELLEMSVIVLIFYGIFVLENGMELSRQEVLAGMLLVVLKGVAKVLRAHPEIPVKDYVNN